MAKTKPKATTKQPAASKAAQPTAAKAVATAKPKATKAKSPGKLEGGEIVLIPLHDGRFGVTKVLYAGHHPNFRNTILLGVSKEIVSSVTAPAKLPKKFGAPFYTWSSAIKKGEWPVVAKDEITDEEQALSIRVNTGKLWSGDELLREATPVDKKKYPLMTTAGPLLAEIKVREHLGLGDPYPEDNPNPMYALAYMRRGRTMAERGEHKEALSEFKTAIDMDANCREAYVARAKLHLAMGNTKAAELDQKKAAELKSK